MTEKEKNKIFLDQLKSRFIEIGLSKAISLKIAKLVSDVIVLEKEKKVISNCYDPFYLDQVIAPQKNEIDEIVKKCWGKDYSFEIETNHIYQTNMELISQPEKQVPIETSAFLFETSPKPHQEITTIVDETKKNPVLGRTIEKDLNFKTFVRCESNTAAYTACEAIAKNPGNLSNPLFIYGSTGLGKTHLLHSVGNEVLKQNPESNILYITSNDFVNDVIHRGIKSGRMEEVRKKYNSCDMLLVDDIQFLENKDACQIEFFHIFNELYQKKKQLVFTSDKFPKDIPNIEERLKSRFLQGLLVDIAPPFFEDRVAIIEVKSSYIGLNIGREISFLIAKHAKTNVREIEGILKDLLISKQISNSEPTIESVTMILKRRFPTQVNQYVNLDITGIQKEVCQHFEIKMSDLMGHSRQKKLVLARHIAMYLGKEMLNLNILQLSESFGKKDHTTALHAISKIKELLEKDFYTKETVENIKLKFHH